jgi:8-oxo-dGTP pyrophosphatase MutT (NUDIX family)
MIRSYFRAVKDGPELRNPHVEPRVSPEVRGRARDAAILIVIVAHQEPTVLVTRRHRDIRFAGHVCFPGGTCDTDDVDSVETALRETQEEIGLVPSDVEVLGSLGDYYTQTGYRIVPVVGVIEPPATLEANPEEVEEIYEISLRRMLSSNSYVLRWRNEERGHISFHEDDVRVAGPTVSMMIGFYEALLSFASS